MPELPEVETLRRTLHDPLVGKRIDALHVFWPRTIEPHALEKLSLALVGRSIVGTRRRGKLLIVDLDDGAALTVHLRMTGELLYRPDARTPRDADREPYLRAVFTLSDGAELCFYDIRKFGRIGYVAPDEALDPAPRIGIEPLSPEFTLPALRALLSRRRAMKPLLLDQTLVAGLGNIYVDEALFRAGIHPLQPADQLTDDQIERLHRSIVAVLSEAIENRGTTFRDYRSGLGESGANKERLRVYGRPAGSVCVECGGTLERLVVGQRGTILCPSCQPLITQDRPRQSSTR